VETVVLAVRALSTKVAPLLTPPGPKIAVSNAPGVPLGDQLAGVDQFVSVPLAAVQRKGVWAFAMREAVSAAEKTETAISPVNTRRVRGNEVIENILGKTSAREQSYFRSSRKTVFGCAVRKKRAVPKNRSCLTLCF
jgi:hypothetical protein